MFNIAILFHNVLIRVLSLRNSARESKVVVNGETTLTIHHLTVAFIALVSGVLLSGAAFGSEHLYLRMRQRRVPLNTVDEDDIRLGIV